MTKKGVKKNSKAKKISEMLNQAWVAGHNKIFMSDYISKIRSKIGNDFLLLPSVTIIVKNDEGKILLVRHHNKNVWVAPGGMIDPDERPHDAAVREMFEETGLEVKLLSIIGTYGGPDFRINYQNGDEVGYVMTVYEAEITGGSQIPDGKEILEIRYFSQDDIEKVECGKWLSVVLHDAFKK